MVVTHTHAKVKRSPGSKTDELRIDGRTEAIALPTVLTRLVNIFPLLQH